MSSTHLGSYFASVPEKERHTSAISFLAALDHLEKHFPSIAAHILKELADQRTSLKLIASENYSSLAVQLAMGNLLTDKYSEGYPYHRFYAGCENVDAIETEAIELAKGLFSAPHAYVQPHSGADANLVAFFAILVTRVQSRELAKFAGKTIDALSPEEYEKIRVELMNQKVMGLGLSSGGHLSHGFRHNISAKIMRASNYEVDRETGLLNYDRIAKQVKEVKPLILLAGYSAYPRLINFAKMREIADSVGAVLMSDIAHFAGLVAGGVLKDEYHPFPYSHVVTTTTHKTLRGPRGGLVFCQNEFAEAVNKGCPLVLGGPLPHVMAAKAVAFREATDPSFAIYAQKIVANSRYLAEALLKEGFSVATKGSDNHLILIDLTPLGISGRQAEMICREAKITLNRNMIPFDQKGPWYTSGIRIGTPALTTLGMGKREMEEIAKIFSLLLRNTRPQKEDSGKDSLAKASCDPAILSQAKDRVQQLLAHFPLYPEIILSGNLS